MRDYEAVFKACEGVDCVFHVAACGMSGLEQASTIFLKFSFVIFEKEKQSACYKECSFTIFMSEVVIKAKSSIQEIREVFLK